MTSISGPRPRTPGPNKRSSAAPRMAAEPGGGWSISGFPGFPNEVKRMLPANVQLTDRPGGHISGLVRAAGVKAAVVIYLSFNK